MSQIDTLPPLRTVIATHGLSARKSLGQNFLLDLNLTLLIPIPDVSFEAFLGELLLCRGRIIGKQNIYMQHYM